MRLRMLAAATLLLGACQDLTGLSGGDEPGAGGDAGPGPDDGGIDSSSDAADGTVNAGSATLVVGKTGTGSGAVTSQDLGIDCGGSCSHLYTVGALVQLTATPLAYSVFNGWGAPCSGTGVCSIPLNGDVTVTATFGAQVLDIDGNRVYEASNDGLLTSRYMFGVTGSVLTDGAIGANALRVDPVTVLAYLNKIAPLLDIDGNGIREALTDALMIQRYMSGLRGDTLTNAAIGVGATRTTAAQIEAYLKTLMP